MAALQSALQLPCIPHGCNFHGFRIRSSYTVIPKQKNPPPAQLPLIASCPSYTRPQLQLFDSECVYDYDCRQLHALAAKLNAFQLDSSIGNKLITLYFKTNKSLEDARKLFDDVPKRTARGYAVLINAYCRLEQWGDLFLLLRLMVNDGFLPDKYLVPTLLKACSALKMLRTGKMVHGFIVRKGLHLDVVVGNSLIHFYANCGDLRYTASVFDAMTEKDVVSWSSFVSAYMDAGLVDEALQVFHSMQSNGVEPDFGSWHALVSGFSQNGKIDLALKSLKEMQEKGLKPRVHSWNRIISGCVNNNHFKDALDVFYNMLQCPNSEDPNSVTIASILPACKWLKNLNLGRAFHGFSVRRELCKTVHVEGSLIDMYVKCGRNDYAEKVFVKAANKNTVMFTEMIAAFVNEGEMTKALDLFRLMQNDGPKPDVVSFNTILAGRARNGQKDEAYELLCEMGHLDIKPDIVTINGLISGFKQSGLSYEALKLFQTMQSPSGSNLSNVLIKSNRPNFITTIGALAACADLSLKQHGKEIHGYVLRNGFDDNIHVLYALVRMYSKCHDNNGYQNMFCLQ